MVKRAWAMMESPGENFYRSLRQRMSALRMSRPRLTTTHRSITGNLSPSKSAERSSRKITCLDHRQDVSPRQGQLSEVLDPMGFTVVFLTRLQRFSGCCIDAGPFDEASKACKALGAPADA